MSIKILISLCLYLGSFYLQGQDVQSKYFEHVLKLQQEENYPEIIDLCKSHLPKITTDVHTLFERSVVGDLSEAFLKIFLLDSAYYYADDLFKKDKTHHLSDTITAKAHYVLGMCHYYYEEFDKSEVHFTRHLDIQEKEFGLNSTQRVKSLVNLGILHTATGSYINALSFLKKALKFLPEVSVEKGILKARIQGNIGNVYHYIGRFPEALRLQQTSLEFFRKSGQPPQVATALNNIGAVYVDLGDHENAVKYYEEALQIKRELYGGQDINTATTLSNLAMSYSYLDRLSDSEQLANQALEVFMREFGPRHYYIAYTYQSQANVLIIQKRFKEALQVCQNALDIFETNYEQNHFFIVQCYLMIAECHIGLKDHENVIKSLDKIEKQLNYDNIINSEFDLTNDPQILFQFLNLKVRGLSELFNPLEYEHELDQLYDDKIRLINYVYNSTYDSKTKSFHVNQLYADYESAIAYWAQQRKKVNLVKACTIAELSKSMFLTEAILSRSLVNNHIIDDSLLTQLSVYSSELNNQHRELFFAKQDSTTINEVNNIESRIVEIGLEKSDLLTHIRSNYQEYYNLRFKDKFVNIKELQSNLVHDQSILEYFMGDSSAYLFVINTDSIHFVELNEVSHIHNSIDSFRHSIIDSWASRGTNNYDSQYHRLLSDSQALYDLLIGPVESKINSNLIIIPDGKISQVPFDALVVYLDSSEAQPTPRYLIENHVTSYAVSARSISLGANESSFSGDQKVGIYAPLFSPNNALPNETNSPHFRSLLHPLYHNQEEAKYVEYLIPSAQVYLGKEATKNTFIDESQDYKIIHLATHSKSDLRFGEASYLAFYSDTAQNKIEKLYSDELYPLNIEADLVVLSACETGLGSYERANGTVSVTNGFIVAGAKSVISSLWSVNDVYSKVFMQSFYKSLLDGKTRKTALHESKLQFAKSSSYSHPFYWASFHLTGATGHLHLEEPHNAIFTFALWTLSFIVIVLLLFIIRRRFILSAQE